MNPLSPRKADLDEHKDGSDFIVSADDGQYHKISNESSPFRPVPMKKIETTSSFWIWGSDE